MVDYTCPSIPRRSLLAAVAATAGAVATSGCLGLGGDDSGDSGDSGDTEDDAHGGHGAGSDDGQDDGGDSSTRSDTTDEFRTFDAPPDETVPVPEDLSCAVCNMQPASHPEWNSQAAHNDGTRAFLCTPGCAVAYSVATDVFGAPESELVSAWVRTRDDYELLSVEEAYYALDSNPDRDVGNPMVNPAVYTDRESATAYVERYDDLDDSDVVHGSELDEENVSQFRDIAYYRDRN